MEIFESFPQDILYKILVDFTSLDNFFEKSELEDYLINKFLIDPEKLKSLKNCHLEKLLENFDIELRLIEKLYYSQEITDEDHRQSNGYW